MSDGAAIGFCRAVAPSTGESAAGPARLEELPPESALARTAPGESGSVSMADCDALCAAAIDAAAISRPHAKKRIDCDVKDFENRTLLKRNNLEVFPFFTCPKQDRAMAPSHARMILSRSLG